MLEGKIEFERSAQDAVPEISKLNAPNVDGMVPMVNIDGTVDVPRSGVEGKLEAVTRQLLNTLVGRLKRDEVETEGRGHACGRSSNFELEWLEGNLDAVKVLGLPGFELELSPGQGAWLRLQLFEREALHPSTYTERLATWRPTREARLCPAGVAEPPHFSARRRFSCPKGDGDRTKST